ncbi:hypothetical protein, partial [Streptococcus oralis]|uniref:hypothetical protein n=1 Tax=Streptococcus oralis TaxID=1303 RepID=UPI001F46F35E
VERARYLFDLVFLFSFVRFFSWFYSFVLYESSLSQKKVVCHNLTLQKKTRKPSQKDIERVQLGCAMMQAQFLLMGY